MVKELSETSRDLLTIKVPEELEDDADTPILRCGPGGGLIIAYRHFAFGRKIHAYNKVGALLYEIILDDPMYKLLSPGLPGYISVDLKGRYKYFYYYRNFRDSNFLVAGNFLVVADPSKVLIFNSKSGAFVHKLMLPMLIDKRMDFKNHRESN